MDLDNGLLAFVVIFFGIPALIGMIYVPLFGLFSLIKWLWQRKNTVADRQDSDG